MRICVLSPKYPPIIGGAELSVHNLMKRIAKKGHDVHVITMKQRNCLSRETVDGVHIHRVLFTSQGFVQLPSYAVAALRKASQVIRKENCEIIHGFTLYPCAIPTSILKQIHKTPAILTIQGVWGVRLLYEPILGHLLKFGVRHVDAITTVSSFLKTNLMTACGDLRKIFVIHNGVDTQLFASSDGTCVRRKYCKGDQRLLVTVSRLDLGKGLEYLIRAVKLLKEDMGVKLLIVGDGPQRDQLEESVRKMKLKERIFFVGPVSYRQVGSYISACDVFVFPSLREGLGNVLIEAVACSKAIVATDCGGPRDIIKHMENGLLVRRGNPRVLAESIKRVLKDENLRKMFAENNRMISESLVYDWNTITDEYLNLYNSLLNGSRPVPNQKC